MVTPHPEPVVPLSLRQRLFKQGRFIYITGCDGAGKTTQAALMMRALRERGEQPYHLWQRFPFYSSIPLLAYARWKGYSYGEGIVSETGEFRRHGYWDFSQSRLLRIVLPWFLLFDATLSALFRVYWPLWCKETIVCEQFVIETMVDLSIGLSDPEFIDKVPGRLFLRIVPDLANVVFLDLPEHLALDRSAALASDPQLGQRLLNYRKAAKAAGTTMISTESPIEEVFKKVLRRLEKG